MSLSEYEFKLKARSWCDNLKKNRILTTADDIASCIHAVSSSSDSDINDNTNVATATIALDMDADALQPSTVHTISTSDHQYLLHSTTNATTISVGLRTIETWNNAYWIITNVGDNNFTIAAYPTSSTSHFLGINTNSSQLTLIKLDSDASASQTPNHRGQWGSAVTPIWTITKIDELSDIQLAASAVANASDSGEYTQTTQHIATNSDNTGQLYLSNSTHPIWIIEQITLNSQSNSDNNITTHTAKRTALLNNLHTAVTSMITAKLTLSALYQLKDTIATILNQLSDKILAKITKHNKTVTPGTATYITDATRSILQTQWTQYAQQKDAACITLINTAAANLTKYTNDTTAYYTDFTAFINEMQTELHTTQSAQAANSANIDEHVKSTVIQSDKHHTLTTTKQKRQYSAQLAQLNNSNIGAALHRQYITLCIKFAVIIVLSIAIIILVPVILQRRIVSATY
jgi:hypothetical protein